MIPKETIDRVFAAAKIEEVVSDYVTLKRRGANMLGLCPFHNEKTPSFTVSPSKGIYKCFGCGKSGHSVGFIMEIEQCSYTDAIKIVAKKYHIEVPEREMTPEEQQRQDDRESMFVVNDFANQWFQRQLWETEEGRTIGLKYFRERGLREDIIKQFQLGYSPEKGNQLTAALKQAGYKEQFIVNNVDTRIGTGLSGKAEDGRLYDRFRDRVIFPIQTISGKTVAFAGRILKKKENTGKYVNSPDSIIYSKTNELYGIYLAKQAIARQNLCYLVEGQMDAISMYQAGIENVVASGGTALTKPQIRLIHRFTNHITVLYDGDAAGIHAALRGIDMFLEENFDVKVVLLPDGEDPDSFARSHNASDFIEYIKAHETDFIRFKTQLLSKEAGRDPQKRSELIKDIVSSISQIPDPITRSVYIKDTSDQLKIQEFLLSKEVSYQRSKAHSEDIQHEEEPKEEPTFIPSTEPAATPGTTDASLITNYNNLLRLIVRYGEHTLYMSDDDPPQEISVGKYIIDQLNEDSIAPPTDLFRRLIEQFTEHAGDPGFKAENFFKFHSDPEISAYAVEQIADKYQLSKIFLKQSISENVVTKVKPTSELDELPSLVNQLLLELKYTIVNQRLDEWSETFKTAQDNHDEDAISELLQIQPILLSARNAISKALGKVIG